MADPEHPHGLGSGVLKIGSNSIGIGRTTAPTGEECRNQQLFHRPTWFGSCLKVAFIEGYSIFGSEQSFVDGPLSRLREKLQMTPEQFADWLGLTVHTVALVEKGRLRNPQVLWSALRTRGADAEHLKLRYQLWLHTRHSKISTSS
jgi:hypothetical protein